MLNFLIILRIGDGVNYIMLEAVAFHRMVGVDNSPPVERNCLKQIRYNHPVRLRRRVQTRCDCNSVSVLVISPPQEGNCLKQIRYNHPVRLRRRVQTRCDCNSVSVLVISPPQEGSASLRRDAIFCDLVGAFVLHIAAMASDPLPFDFH